jgi:putative membrane protein
MNSYKMKRLAVTLASLSLSVACGDDDSDDVVSTDGDGDGGGAAGDGGQQDAGQLQSDGELAAVVSTANAGEVAQGRIALDKAQATQVLEFAQSMVDEHTANEQQQAQLLAAQGISLESNERSERLKADSDRIVDALTSTPEGTEFDKTYMQSQVDVHREVLDLLEEELIPNAENPALAEYLQATADAVEGHLSHAEDILETLDAGPQDGGASGSAGGTAGSARGDAGTASSTPGSGSGTGIGISTGR